MSSNENETNTRSPADLGWDDGVLWDDEDLAAFLKVKREDVDDAVASGIPTIYLRVTVGGQHNIARRFVPAVVRDHCARRSLSIITPPTRPLSTPPTSVTTNWARRYRGSGRLVQS